MLKTILATLAVATTIVAVAMPIKSAKPSVSTLDAKPAIKQVKQTQAMDCNDCNLPKCPVAPKPDCGSCPGTGC